MTSPPSPGPAFLARLLQLSERFPNRIRPASLSPEYDELKTADQIEQFRLSVEQAEKSGAVVVRKGRRERRHLVDRVIVKDAAALARHLGRTPAIIAAQASRMQLEPAIAEAEPWVGQVLDEMEARWARTESAYRLQPAEIEPAREFLMLLAAISKGAATGLDARSFALRVIGDTKSFDRHATRIAGILAGRFGDPAMPPHLIWKRIGLERFPHPVHLRGPVLIADADRIILDGLAAPFASVHPDMLPFIRLSGRPSLLMTIENYATFNRYVREVDDGGLLVYTAGFPSVAVLNTLRALLALIEPAVPFFHWGDIDPGGLRIFSLLEETLPRRPSPYLMDRKLAERFGKDAKLDAGLSVLGSSHSAVAPLAAWLAAGPHPKHLEQEAIDPISPVDGAGAAQSVLERMGPSEGRGG